MDKSEDSRGADMLIIIRAARITFLSSLLWLPAMAQFTQQGNKLSSSDAIGSAQQGQSVAISVDGNTAIIGGAFDDYDFGASWIIKWRHTCWTRLHEHQPIWKCGR